MRKKVKFLGIFMLILIGCACSSNDEVRLDKRHGKETQAKTDSCIVKITDYVFSEIYDYAVDEIRLKNDKVKVFIEVYGKHRKIPYNIDKAGSKGISLELKTGYMNFTTYYSSNPWIDLPNITVHDADSMYLVSVQNVELDTNHGGYREKGWIVKDIPFNKNGNKIETQWTGKSRNQNYK